MEIKPGVGLPPISPDEGNIQATEVNPLQSNLQESPVQELNEQNPPDPNSLRQEAKSAVGNLSLEGQMMRTKVDTQFSIDSGVPHSRPELDAKMSALNLNRKETKDGQFIQYPNGVISERGEGLVSGLQPPPGGSFKDVPDGGRIVLDAHGRTAAKLEKDGTLHVYTSKGEYIEKKDGSVTFKGRDGRTSIENQHKNGVVRPSNYENYGISTGGKLVRFPNGVELDTHSNRISVRGSVKEVKQNEGIGTKSTYYDDQGNKLCEVDSKGVHIPTADGMLTRKPNGEIVFEKN